MKDRANRTGDFRHLVTIQKPDPNSPRDAVGQRVTAWLNVATLYARVEPLSNAEKFIAAQQRASTSHKVAIFYDSSIAAIDGSWRLLFGARIFVIDGVSNTEERNIVLILDCTEGLRNE